MPELFQLPSYPTSFSLSRENVPTFAEIAKRAQNNGGPAVLLPKPSFDFALR